MQDKPENSHWTDFIKKAKKYTAIFLGIGTLFFAGCRRQQQTNAPTNDTHLTKAVQSVNTPISNAVLEEKINFVINNMLELNTTNLKQFDLKQLQLAKKINSSAKKEAIRQNFLKYISVPEGKKLLSSLDVTKVLFIDTGDLHSGDGKTVGFCSGDKNKQALVMDFEGIKNLPIFHHEGTHAWQKQVDACTKNGKLAELEAYLNQVKFTDQALQQGILTTNDLSGLNQELFFNYQKYNRDDIQFTLYYLHPWLTWEKNYWSQFLLSDQNTEKELSQYAQQLGLSKKNISSFVQKLTDDHNLKQVSYHIDDQGKESTITKLGDSWGAKTKTQTGVRDGTLITVQYQKGWLFGPDNSELKTWKKIKEHYEKGDHIQEIIIDPGTDKVTEETVIDGKTKTHFIYSEFGCKATRNFVDENNNPCTIIYDDTGILFNKVIQKFVNGKLVKETKTSSETGLTETKELKNGKWSTSLRHRLQEATEQSQPMLEHTQKKSR